MVMGHEFTGVVDTAMPEPAMAGTKEIDLLGQAGDHAKILVDPAQG